MEIENGYNILFYNMKCVIKFLITDFVETVYIQNYKLNKIKQSNFFFKKNIFISILKLKLLINKIK